MFLFNLLFEYRLDSVTCIKKEVNTGVVGQRIEVEITKIVTSTFDAGMLPSLWIAHAGRSYHVVKDPIQRLLHHGEDLRS